MSWDASKYASRLKKKCSTRLDVEDNLTKTFEPLVPAELVLDRTKPLPVVPDPAIFVDCAGRIMAISLPSIIPARLQVRAMSLVFPLALIIRRRTR